MGRLNPVRYLKGSLDAIVVAFSSASSAGTLPVSIRCAQKNLGVSEGVSGFVLPVAPPSIWMAPHCIKAWWCYLLLR